MHCSGIIVFIQIQAQSAKVKFLGGASFKKSRTNILLVLQIVIMILHINMTYVSMSPGH